MSDNVNIIVQDTINEIVVNTAVVVETIDINVQVAVDEVNIIANPNNYVVNINRIIGEQVQSDWDQNDDQEPDYIKNKPSIPSIAGLATVVYVDQQDNLKVDKVAGKGLSENDFTNTLKTKLDGIESGAQVNVNADWNATTGDAEILNKPTIPAAQVNSDWNATSGVEEILNKPTIPAAVTNTSELINDGEDGVNPFITAADLPTSVTSVGLTMPSAFNVANSPITSAGTLAVTGAGVVSQYVRGDGSLANFPTSTGGGASVSYYLNGSVSQGTIGGVAYKEINGVPVIGTGTDFTINADGYIAQFITDVGDPNKLLIPAGNWNFETYFSASSNGGSPRFYIELYKYNGATFTLISSNSATPENITGGTSIDLYLTALAIPPTTLLATDRLAVRFYVIHSGRTITMHTENSHLSQIITTFSTGLTALNGLTTQVQSFATGTSGTDFGISSATSTHTFNLPTASATNRGALSSADWSAFNGKFNLPSLTSGSVLFSNGTTIAQDNANLFWDDTNNRLGIGTASPTNRLHVLGGILNGAVATFSGQNNDRGLVISTFNSGNSDAGVLLNAQTSLGVLSFATVGSEHMRISATGNVGIGMTAPTAKLAIKAGGALSTDIALRVRNSADTGDLMTVNGLGNVGIGTSAPLYKADLVGNDINSGLGFSDGTSRFGNIFKLNNDIYILANRLSTSKIYIGAGTAESYPKYLTIDGSTGNVGIGTATPTSKLDVSGAVNVRSAAPTITFDRNSSYTWKLVNGDGVTYPTSTFNIANNGGTSVVTFLDSGNVGIGMTAPTAKLAIKAPGALSTDIALRVRNSADTGDLATIGGTSILTVGGIGNDGSINLARGSNGGIMGAIIQTSTFTKFINYQGTGFDFFVDAATSTQRAFIRGTGVGISGTTGGTFTLDASALLQANSTTQGVLFPRMTTTQKNAIATPATGLVVYDTTLNKLCVRGASAWETITSI